jgi:ADP-ribose pyrophosphatase YjhB (NUDIX family)
MHHIQQQILIKLTEKSPQQFSQLQIDDVPNNSFSYHLKKLVEKGYLHHSKNGYEPTRKALKIYHFGDNVVERRNSPLLITSIFLTNPKGQVMLYKRMKSPFKGWYGIPSGVVHFGESLEEAAQRELFEKTGLKISRTLIKEGSIDFRYRHKETKDIFVHAVSFVFSYLKTSAVELPKNCIWSELKDEKILPEVFLSRDLIEKKVSIIVSEDFIEPNS